MSEEEVIFRDFTVKRRPIAFGISGVKYHCIPAIGTEDLQQIAKVFKKRPTVVETGDETADTLANIEAHMETMRQAFRLFLQPESYDDFLLKLKDRVDPVDVNQLTEIVGWVIGKYTKDPTEPSLTSSDTSPNDDDGSGSTAGVPLKTSTPWNLTQLDSST